MRFGGYAGLSCSVFFAWLVFLPQAAQSQPPQSPPPGEVFFAVCNKTEMVIWFAFVSRISPADARYHTHGWYRSEPKPDCSVLWHFPPGKLYWYAMGGVRSPSEYEWKGTALAQCVADTTFDRLNGEPVPCDQSHMKLFADYNISPSEIGKQIEVTIPKP